MRFGCCLNMVAMQPDGTGIENIEKLAGLGYDYAELPLAEMMVLPERERQGIILCLKRSKIKCEVCNNFFPGTIRLTGNDTDPEAIMEYAENALSFASSLGVEYVVFGSGKAKNVPENFPIADGYRQVVGLLKNIGPVAKEKNITIVIEPLRKAECNLINTFEEGCRLADDVGHSNVKVLVDYYHFCVEQEPIENLLLKGKKYLRHVHFSNPNGRVFPSFADENGYGEFIEALKKIGYSQRVSCEAYSQDFAKDAEKAIRFFKESFA
ncbi:MAG: sugar phosphate isomerase/epimerase family protein [Acetivibrionales bacterium]|jgi:D-psicose/D-tagatose/L-ribulose 3-epimerase